MTSPYAVTAISKPLQANYTLDMDRTMDRTEDYVRSAKNFLILLYNLEEYVNTYGGSKLTGRVNVYYRKEYAMEIKLTAWFMDLLQ